MRELYRQELAQLGSELERMGRGVSRAIERATTALTQADLAVAEQTIDADERLDENARAIDEMCVHLLALQGPVASDLRLILAALRLSATMERQGDLARHIASIARTTYPNPSIAAPAAALVTRMSEAAAAMGALEERLITTQDLSIADEMQRFDDTIDELQVEIYRLIIDPGVELSRQEIMDLTLGARFLERFADHAVSVARRVAFAVEGAHAARAEGGIDAHL